MRRRPRIFAAYRRLSDTRGRAGWGRETPRSSQTSRTRSSRLQSASGSSSVVPVWQQEESINKIHCENATRTCRQSHPGFTLFQWRHVYVTKKKRKKNNCDPIAPPSSIVVLCRRLTQNVRSHQLCLLWLLWKKVFCFGKKEELISSSKSNNFGWGYSTTARFAQCLFWAFPSMKLLFSREACLLPLFSKQVSLSFVRNTVLSAAALAHIQVKKRM